MSLFPRERTRDMTSERFALVKMSAISFNIWAETIIGFVNNFAVRVDCNRNNIFLHCHSIIKISLAVEKLLKSDHLVINNFPLRLQFGFKHDILVLAIADDWH